MRRLTPAQVRLLILVVTTLAACWAALAAIDADRTPPETAPASTAATVPVPETNSTTSSSSTTTSTTTTTTIIPAEAAAAFRCPTWVAINHAAGFPVEELATADRILFAESRCRLDAVNLADVNGGSWCGYQINRIHEGHLVESGVIDYWEQLIEDPRRCAAAAFTVYTRSNGWTPWATY
jgi:hypothetical protein